MPPESLTRTSGASPLADEIFWMVFCQGAASPTICHYTKQSANDEAARLATKMGAPCYVLQMVTRVDAKISHSYTCF